MAHRPMYISAYDLPRTAIPSSFLFSPVHYTAPVIEPGQPIWTRVEKQPLCAGRKWQEI